MKGDLDIQGRVRIVARILKHLDYRLRVNHKRLSAASGPDRDEQFRHIAAQRRRFAERGLPIVSIDTKKRDWSAISRTTARLGNDPP